MTEPPADDGSLQERARHLPTGPGCYIFRDAAGRELYVGKAVNLRRRVASYFSARRGLPERTTRLAQAAADLSVIETASEVEALLLENRLIKDLRPPFNVRLKDDKEYPLLAITREEFPRVFITRDRRLEKVRYYGPFTASQALHGAYQFLQRVFTFRVCTRIIASDDPRRRFQRVCLNYHIKRCSGPCAGRIAAEAYRRDIAALMAFLAGRGAARVRRDLERRMAAASTALRYEEAARLRDQIRAIGGLRERGRPDDYQVAPAPVIEAAGATRSLARALAMASPPRCIETFDIAHLQGRHVVASMVQFVDGVPNRDAYRRYRIREQQAMGDDCAAIHEVVHRRYRRRLAESQPLPDLVVVDGGLGQVHAAAQALATLGLEALPLIGLAKREEEIIRADVPALRLSRRNAGLKLLMYARDEAHRFARRYFHLLQGKAL